MNQMSNTIIKIRSVGTSLGVILPKKILTNLQINEGDGLRVEIENETIKLTPRREIQLNRSKWREIILSNKNQEFDEVLLSDYIDEELECFM